MGAEFVLDESLAQVIKAKIHAEIIKRGVKVKEFEQALEPLIVAKRLKPDFLPTVYLLALTYNELNNVWGDKAPELLLEANDLVRLMPRCYDAYQFRGMAWATLGRPKAFERDFETANQLRPNDPMLLIAKAHGYGKLDNLRREAETFKEAIDLYPDNKYCSMWYDNLAGTYQRLGDCSADAITAYQKATARGQRNFKYQVARCRNQPKGRP